MPKCCIPKKRSNTGVKVQGPPPADAVQSHAPPNKLDGVPSTEQPTAMDTRTLEEKISRTIPERFPDDIAFREDETIMWIYSSTLAREQTVTHPCDLYMGFIDGNTRFREDAILTKTCTQRPEGGGNNVRELSIDDILRAGIRRILCYTRSLPSELYDAQSFPWVITDEKMDIQAHATRWTHLPGMCQPTLCGDVILAGHPHLIWEGRMGDAQDQRARSAFSERLHCLGQWAYTLASDLHRDCLWQDYDYARTMEQCDMIYRVHALLCKVCKGEDIVNNVENRCLCARITGRKCDISRTYEWIRDQTDMRQANITSLADALIEVSIGRWFPGVPYPIVSVCIGDLVRSTNNASPMGLSKRFGAVSARINDCEPYEAQVSDAELPGIKPHNERSGFVSLGSRDQAMQAVAESVKSTLMTRPPQYTLNESPPGERVNAAPRDCIV